MCPNQPIDDIQAKSSPMLIIYMAIGILAALVTFGTALIINFSVLSSLFIALFIASPLTIVRLLVLNFFLSCRKIDLDVEAAQPFMD